LLKLLSIALTRYKAKFRYCKEDTDLFVLVAPYENFVLGGQGEKGDFQFEDED